MRFCVNMTRVCVLIAVALIALASAAPVRATQAELNAAMDMAPAGAPIVFVVPNLTAFDQKLAKLNQTLGIGSQDMAHALEEFKRNSGLIAGINDKGGVLVALMDVSMLNERFESGSGAVEPGEPGDEAPEENGVEKRGVADGGVVAGQPGGKGKEPPLLFFIAVTDYKQFLGNLRDTRVAGEVTEGLTIDGEKIFCRDIKGYAVISNDLATLRGYKAEGKGAGWSAACGKSSVGYLNSGDAALFLNVEKMASVLQPLVAKATAEMRREMEGAPTGMDPQAAVLVKAVASLYGDAAAALVRDISMASVCLEITDKGVGLMDSVQFKPGSYLAKMFTTGGSASGELAKLADQPYLAALAMSAKGIDIKSLVQNVKSRIPAGREGELQQLVDAYMLLTSSFDKTKAISAAYYLAANPMPGGGLFNAVSLIHSSDAAGIRKIYREYGEAVSKAMSALYAKGQGGGAVGGEEEGVEGGGAMEPGTPPAAPHGGDGEMAGGSDETMAFNYEYTPDAVQIDGVSADRFSSSFNMGGQGMQGNPAAPFMMMLGLNQQTGYFAQSGDYLVGTVWGDTAAMSKALAALKQDKGLGSGKLLQQVRAEGLPADSTVEAYLSASGIAALANTFLVMFGGPQIQVPAELPPVGFGMALQDSGVTGRLYVPTAVMTFVKDAVDQMKAPPPQRGQGGGSPGGRQQGGKRAPGRQNPPAAPR